MVITFITATAFANETTQDLDVAKDTPYEEIHCKIIINNEIVFEGNKALDHTPGEPEGSGTALVLEHENIKVYATSYPVMIIVNYLEDDIVIKAKTSFVTGVVDLVLNRNERVARINARMPGYKVEARCNNKNSL